MSVNEKIKQQLTELIKQVEQIETPIICDNAVEIRELSHQLFQQIHEKISPPQKNIVEFF
ncbi:MAG TPA: hypothetical protein ACHBX6_00035 [Arsenophonus nasoniae]|uniref:Uncharacterized protein n=1 Tax=Arsenophonus nasoniae TaxID=638 RepID=A0AA95GG41_9GAMM|nr:hypothetical protein [Arsenophonus nasoniae]WGL94641.1 hypothetical protein QE207_13115 [Arsenophonus nasoniae]WGL95329.1 hypothetical protein QE207_17065 [Arsenophonus nasoniae]